MGLTRSQALLVMIALLTLFGAIASSNLQYRFAGLKKASPLDVLIPHHLQ